MRALAAAGEARAARHGPMPKLLGDQDGLFGAACSQYRDSMDPVAEWARAQA